MSATQIIASVRAAAPGMNPFPILSGILRKKFYPKMPDAYITSLRALHIVYGIQLILLVAALVIRARGTGDMWLFRLRSTSRGRYIVPHFAVAWQVGALTFVAVLQVYVQLCVAHVEGQDWLHYIAGRTLGFIPAWISVWLCLWSLAVAMVLPRSAPNARNRHAWYTSPMVVNTHFLAGIVVCVVTIGTPSFLASTHYDNSVARFHDLEHAFVNYARAFAAMSADQVNLAFSEVAPVLQNMLDESKAFKADFRIAWAFWFVVIVYSYSIFLVLAARHFTYLRQSMLQVAGVDGKTAERAALRKSWWFSALTSMLVTFTGVCYTGTALYCTVWTEQSTSSVVALQVETLVALYSEAAFGLVASILALAQTLVGNNTDINAATSSGSKFGGVSSSRKGDAAQRHVHVSVHTRTHVDSDDPAVVQLELADWANHVEKNEKSYAGL